VGGPFGAEGGVDFGAGGLGADDGGCGGGGGGLGPGGPLGGGGRGPIGGAGLVMVLVAAIPSLSPASLVIVIVLKVYLSMNLSLIFVDKTPRKFQERN
jgi:hypothetical protein